MNILRLSTLTLTLAIAAFSLGYVNPSFAGKPVDGEHDHGGGSTGGDDATYSVEIVGDNLAGDSFLSPPWHDGGRKNSIGGH